MKANLSFFSTLWLGIWAMWGLNPCLGQLPKGDYLSMNSNYGRIFVHTSNIRTPINANTTGLELSYERKLKGLRLQHIFANYPQVGILLSYQNFNQQYIGWGLGICPHISMNFAKYKFFRLYGRLAVGVGYLSDHYNLASNTYNNIVSSHICNNTILNLSTGWQLGKKWELRAGFQFSHYSNGASQLPNYGINVTSAQLGLCYMPQPLQKSDLLRLPDSLPKFNRKWYLNTVAAIGMRESTTYGGAKYPIYHLGLDLNRWITRLHRAKIGVEGEYIGSVAAFLDNIGTYSGREAHWQACRWSAYAGFEIVWGRFTLGANVGAYLSNHALQPTRVHSRLVARYYLADPVRAKFQPYVGWNLKTHRIIAEYMCVNVGLLW